MSYNAAIKQERVVLFTYAQNKLVEANGFSEL